MWIRYRFSTRYDDYRPAIFNPAYPWWCTGGGEDNKGEFSIIIAYLPKAEDLMNYWDDAYDINKVEKESIVFSERFPKPDYFVET